MNKNIDIDSIARLSRLEFTAEEKERMLGELENFAGFAACLSAYELLPEIEGAEDMESCGAREDIFVPSAIGSHVLISQSEGESDGFIRVPITVVEEDV